MTDHIDNLKSLHTSLIDSRNGHDDEALKDAEGKGLTHCCPMNRKVASFRITIDA